MRSTIFTMRRTAITVLFTGAVASCGYFFRCWIFLAIQAIGSFGFLPSRSGGILCLAFFVSHPGSSALVTV